MGKLFMGSKPGVGGVVKVMKNNSDDPLTTPNTDYSKFLFNSETTKIGYVEALRTSTYVSGMSSNQVRYYPGGTNSNNCERMVRGTDPTQTHWIFGNRIINRPYPVVTESRERKPLGQKIRATWVDYTDTTPGGSGRCGYSETNQNYVMALYRDPYPTGLNFSQPIAAAIAKSPHGGFWESSHPDMLTAVLDLPAHNDPMPSAPAGVSGTRNTLISPTTVRIGKGGVAANGGRDSIIIDSDRVPAKVVKSGEVSIAGGGSTTINVPVTLTPDCYMDFMVYRPNVGAYVPPLWSSVSENDAYRFGYRIRSNSVELINDYSARLAVRYMIIWDDGARRGGGSQVLRETSGGNFQIKRPGSSDSNPASKDILLDTRFAYLPILKEGVFDPIGFFIRQ